MTARAGDGGRGRPGRVDSVDFWRGIVLCTIFINHIPGNAFEFMTQKNFGLSDSAEAFVFLSGVSLALAYGPRFVKSRATPVFSNLASRAVRLYGIHIVLTLAAVGIFAVDAMVTTDTSLFELHGRDLFIDDPRAALIGLVSLGHQLGYFNILPLYVVLLAPAALLLWAGRERPWAMLGGSLAAYLAARLWGVNIPTWPMKGTWFFDPFVWQFMMTLGMFAGLVLRGRSLPRSTGLAVLAAAVAAWGLVSVTDGFGLAPGLRDWTAGWADLDKTMLGAGRILHFLAVAYLVALLDLTGLLKSGVLHAPLCRLGRHSLVIFSVLSLLATIGQVLSERLGHSLPLDGAMILLGLLALYGVATLLESRRAAVVRSNLAKLAGA